MDTDTANPFMSTAKISDPPMQVALHPLPLLEISDYITRCYVRRVEGAIVGVLLGKQNGRDIKIEYSAECKVVKQPEGHWDVHDEWLRSRVDQMKVVHQSGGLELVGWYSLVDKSGPTSVHVPIHKHMTEVMDSGSAILLGFHIQDIINPKPGEIQLPVTVYEGSLESPDNSSKRDRPDDEDKEMVDSEQDVQREATWVTRFRELPFTTDAGDAEMVALEFIRHGGVNRADASAVYTQQQNVDHKAHQVPSSSQPPKQKADAKGKQPATMSESTCTTETNDKGMNLSKDEALYVSTIRTKINAIKMMRARVALIISYLESLPPAFVAGQQTSAAAIEEAAASQTHTRPSNKILRQILALITNIGLAAPAPTSATQDPPVNTLAKDILSEANDVRLVSLLADLMESAKMVRDTCKKYNIVESARMGKTRELCGGRNFGGGAKPGIPVQAGDLFT